MHSSNRLVVILFTDLVGSTALKNQLGATAYARLLVRHDALFRECIALTPGQIVQGTGDGFYARFDTASDAVRCALLFQRAMAAEDWGGVQLRSRAGIEAGEVAEIPQPNGEIKLVGMAVDLASRIMSLAVGGQTLLTHGPFNDARLYVREYPTMNGDGAQPLPPLRWIAHGPYVFKGSEEAVEIFEVGGEGLAPLTAPPDAEKARRAIRPGEEQVLGWRPALGAEMPSAPNWKIAKKLGEGGFGEVWLAEHAKTRRHRVFKFCFDIERLRALKREVALFRLLKEALGDRPDTAKVIDYHFDSPPYFIEMEHAPEGNLTDWSARQGGIAAVPLATRLSLVSRTADAVAAAHSVGILHKDIKASNILIITAPDGGVFPRLTDFGIGLVTDRTMLQKHEITMPDFTLTRLGDNDSSRTGTRMYAPPESMTGSPFTIQGDIYALGVLLYQMVIGDLTRPLAVGWEREVKDEILREDIALCVEGDPARRLSSAAELARRLENLEKRRDERHLAQRRLARRKRRRTLIVVGSTAAVVMLLAITNLLTWREARKQGLRAVEGEKLAIRNAAKAAEGAAEARRRAREAEINYADSLVAEGDALAVNENWKEAKGRYEQATRVYVRNDIPPARADLAMLQAYEHAPPPLLVMKQPTGIAENDPFVQGFYMAAGRSANQSIGHLESITSLSLSQDGRLALTGVRHAPMTLWDMVSGRLIRSFNGHHAGEPAAALSLDAKLALSGGCDGTLTLWNIETGEAVNVVRLAHFGKITNVALSADGKRAVSAGGTPTTVKLWDIAGGKSLKSFSPGGGVDYLALSHDGAKLVVGRSYQTPRLFSTQTGKELPLSNEISAQKIGTCALAFADDGALVATGEIPFGSGSYRMMNAETGQVVNSFPFSVQDSTAYSQDGRLSFFRFSDRIATLADVFTGKHVRRLTEHDDGFVLCAMTRDARIGATAGSDTALRTWGLGTHPQIRPLPLPRKGYAGFSPDGRMLLVGGVTLGPVEYIGEKVSPGDFELLDISTGRRILSRSFAYPVRCWCFTADGTNVVLGCEDGSVRTWNLVSDTESEPRPCHQGPIDAIAISPDGKILATGGDDSTVKLWDMASGAALHSMPGHRGHVWNAVFSRDGRYLFSGSYYGDGVLRDNYLKQWDVRSGALVHSFMSRGVCGLSASSRPGSIFASIHSDSSYEFSPIDGKKVRELVPPGNGSLVVSSDGALIVRSDVYKGHLTIRFWEDRGTNPAAEYNGGVDERGQLAISPDSRHVLAGRLLCDLHWPRLCRELRPRADVAREALQLNPNDPSALKTLGEWYVFNGMWEWAAELLGRARDRNAEISHTTLGQCYWNIDKPAEAMNEFTRALSIAKDDDERLYLTLCLRGLHADKAH